MATNEELVAAIREMGDALSASEDALGHFTCGEVEPLFRVLVLAGFDDLARSLIIGHGPGDSDPGDHHHSLYLEGRGDWDGPDQDVLAHAFVRELKTGEPTKKWRNLFGDGKEHDYYTVGERDEHAPHLAKAYGTTVLSQMWSRDNPQDEVNGGWAVDATVPPPPAVD